MPLPVIAVPSHARRLPRARSAHHLTTLYLAYAVAGLGAGIVYGTAIGSALKWFPDHRGLAAGLTAAGFGAGSALTVSPIANVPLSDFS